jgi:hypothetical protein
MKRWLPEGSNRGTRFSAQPDMASTAMVQAKMRCGDIVVARIMRTDSTIENLARKKATCGVLATSDVALPHRRGKIGITGIGSDSSRSDD